MERKTLNYGLVLLPRFQWLDAAGSVDFINNYSYGMFSILPNVPKSIIDKTPIIKWHYIASDMSPVHPSSGPPQLPTCTYEDCPPLDVLFVPGPDPFIPAPKDFISFIQKRFVRPDLKALFLVCTASIAVAESGILDGRHVCSAKAALRNLAEAGTLNRNVKWVGDRRWIVDGKIWSSAGVTSGLDLAAEFGRVHFDEEVGRLALDIQEYEPNPAQPDPFARLLEGIEL